MDDGVTEGAWPWVDGVVVGGVGDNVVLAVSASHGVTAEAYGAACQLLAVALPVPVTPPAVVDWIACPA